jgi:hypothetical protein
MTLKADFNAWDQGAASGLPIDPGAHNVMHLLVFPSAAAAAEGKRIPAGRGRNVIYSH